MTGSVLLHEIKRVDGITIRHKGTYETVTINFIDKDGMSSDITLFSAGDKFESTNFKIKEIE